MTLLKPVRQQKISDQVFEQLKELIFRGKLKPGDQLMPERDMAFSMNVSRTTIRNAINRLVTMRLVKHKQGKGTFVAIPDPQKGNPFATAMQAQDANIYDLLEVRMGLECIAASLAAQRANSTDIKDIEHNLFDMKKEVTAGNLGSRADISFHMAIAYATKNPLHIQVMKTFYDYLSHGIMESLQFLYEDPNNIQIILNQHKDILKAIKDRDPEAAYTNMKNHIEYVKTFFKEKEK
ncbi:MAG: FadR/GntR family transcriptional regulator [Pseudomonadota bacterium]